MRYFELLDDVTVPQRWQLGEVRAQDGTEPRLRVGIRQPDVGPLEAEVTKPGRVLDFSLTSFAVPIAAASLANAIVAIAGSDVQCLPVNVAGQAGMLALNVVRVVRCIDETRSEFLKWTARDHRADLAGQYRQVTRLVVDPASIPADARFFRPEGWLVALVVSERVKAAMERAGCLGAKFVEVSPSPRQLS